ncbi:YkgJ family cysteine cluster protein [Noviherbaspirillum denitrificans]|uniref:YkgJ family cysteine cluster protein n=1 Tax=Noviherbaspirillum denitrificans TaxID=1968433 RepID=UPI000B533B41|nr:YkgJ family cysteine cluster protein [Noviherbaspirillum denitrificans]
MTFPCTSCGLCCRHVDRTEATQWLDRGDGTCVHLNLTERTCDIYDTRPEVCRIDDAFTLFAHQLNLIAYYRANADVCNSLQREHDFPSHYKITIQES